MPGTVLSVYIILYHLDNPGRYGYCCLPRTATISHTRRVRLLRVNNSLELKQLEAVAPGFPPRLLTLQFTLLDNKIKKIF